MKCLYAVRCHYISTWGVAVSGIRKIRGGQTSTGSLCVYMCVRTCTMFSCSCFLHQQILWKGYSFSSSAFVILFCFFFVCVSFLFCYSNHPERWEAVAYCSLFCFETGAGLLCLLVLGPKGCSTLHSSHCGFHLHFLANQQCWESLYVIVGRNANVRDETVLPLAPMCALCDCQIGGLPRPRGLLSSPASCALLSFFTCSDPTCLISFLFLVLLSHSRNFLPRYIDKDLASLVFSPNNFMHSGFKFKFLVNSCTFLILKITCMYLCVWVCTFKYTWAVQFMCGGRKMAHRGTCSLVLEMELRLSGLTAGAFSHQATSPTLGVLRQIQFYYFPSWSCILKSLFICISRCPCRDHLALRIGLFSHWIRLFYWHYHTALITVAS